jgi:hypothetical protein
MKIKPGANIQGLQLPMRAVLIDANRIWLMHGQELVITGGLDGEHSPGSMHYYGYALDLRTNYFADSDECIDVATELKDALGGRYYVKFESDHIHVHYRIDNLTF